MDSRKHHAARVPVRARCCTALALQALPSLDVSPPIGYMAGLDGICAVACLRRQPGCDLTVGRAAFDYKVTHSLKVGYDDFCGKRHTVNDVAVSGNSGNYATIDRGRIMATCTVAFRAWRGATRT